MATTQTTHVVNVLVTRERLCCNKLQLVIARKLARTIGPLYQITLRPFSFNWEGLDKGQCHYHLITATINTNTNSTHAHSQGHPTTNAESSCTGASITSRMCWVVDLGMAPYGRSGGRGCEWNWIPDVVDPVAASKLKEADEIAQALYQVDDTSQFESKAGTSSGRNLPLLNFTHPPPVPIWYTLSHKA
ncbi:hypothetical protein BDN72DRAFT_438834 [Pluteus cervinus]|uniref:Uncharacterized protein n=1 Tax=Pluteus cervinus TaxID=181527 RepID=A0ACD3A7J9_9AGAR|nr:hypothetical protein BDN72DRAFT_438834 [Pluteus cervinus]